MAKITCWEDYIGQENIIANLKMYVEASLILKKPLDHILIYGNSGMGKTTLAYLIGSVMKVKVHVLNGPSLQKPSDIISVLTNIKDNEIIFIDEVHAISKEVTEVLYPAIEEGEINIIIGKEYNSKSINISLPPFTLIAATTELDKLPTPFFNRFPIYFTLQPYNEKEMGEIITNYAKSINLPLNNGIGEYIGKFARNTPRTAINLTKRINDFYLTSRIENLDNRHDIKMALEQIDVYENGLTKSDLDYLKAIANHKVVGLDNLAQILNMPIRIISNVIEPLLISEGYVLRTIKGRSITEKGRMALKKAEI
ncbi:Holliday junction branch migration DNA helicase RuvB [Mesoplasma lactucae]|uniref:Holliday junction branch migration complex subunit RuvB n=1 Tax=Mesoplasma lactucae ATCC 49193 TaxID=81460 RepID=A0A291IRJ6_9MOLU|nr:Holliday junction branch migration DNA helicase RuvB [Mesoplasma lactucae]ATG97409.1 Holliday junction branch migration DNA helicase RuvB [Mesoplasma lactucae ATCC 49193]ATZ20138.1 Holliday junction DNA helicase RuvB [Mesoplasma lactucae ATCC 49193]MCL8216886.1 Holliday junction ATP-dependent DNA helicase RuvB [Mesoplasma lactucae ATCC 49193]